MIGVRFPIKIVHLMGGFGQGGKVMVNVFDVMREARAFLVFFLGLLAEQMMNLSMRLAWLIVDFVIFDWECELLGGEINQDCQKGKSHERGFVEHGL